LLPASLNAPRSGIWAAAAARWVFVSGRAERPRSSAAPRSRTSSISAFRRSITAGGNPATVASISQVRAGLLRCPW